ncbi:GTP-binding protein REM 1 isoform X2 [Lepisosteus oculatus]|uniref:GTP-binding protein REM 1 isoform X2 n=1 Tax=Lepisosteus oculatus TaxID=7918 RepID=UPI0035F52616
MTLNTQRDSKETLRRRASTPIPSAHQSGAKDGEPAADPHHPALGHSASYHPGDKTLHSRASWSTDSEDSDSSGAECLYRVVLLGDHGVGKSSLATIFAGIQEKDLSDHPGEDTYERTLTVDGEETTLIVMDTWEAEKQEEDERWVQDYCMQVGNAYVIVYSITDRASFESASELRIQLRRLRQAEDIPIILVGNKSDLVRCREVAVEEGRACAVVFDCKFIETSASLHHNVQELFEGIVRQIRLRRDSKETNERRRSVYRRKESVTRKARRFLDRLVAKNNKKMALKSSSSPDDLQREETAPWRSCSSAGNNDITKQKASSCIKLFLLLHLALVFPDSGEPLRHLINGKVLQVFSSDWVLKRAVLRQ